MGGVHMLFTRRVALGTLIGVGISLSSGGALLAAVSADEARAIGTKLTEFGAEIAGSPDGSIPKYAGGLQPVAGYKDTDPRYIDPFATEKPLYTIDAKNASQYSDLLTEGQKALLSRFPDTYRLDVYSSHRTMRYPAYVLANMVRNATTAQLVNQPYEGAGVSGAAPDGSPFPGIAFPIPKNGFEVMWNHHLKFVAPVTHSQNSAWFIDVNGNRTALPTSHQWYMRPWYEQSGELRKLAENSFFVISAGMVAPPSANGMHFLEYFFSDGSDKIWFYTPGQRRIRAAPDFAYDLPINSFGGINIQDDQFGFTGRMDRFNFKLLGKKEMIVPYNAFRFSNSTSDEILGKQHINPGVERYEKHRVWVVEATRKPGVRHIYSKRTYYIDEDSWAILAVDMYDDSGKLWRTQYTNVFPTYNVGGINVDTYITYDLSKGVYSIMCSAKADPGNFIHAYQSHEGLVRSMLLTPQAVANAKVR